MVSAKRARSSKSTSPSSPPKPATKARIETLPSPKRAALNLAHLNIPGGAASTIITNTSHPAGVAEPENVDYPLDFKNVLEAYDTVLEAACNQASMRAEQAEEREGWVNVGDEEENEAWREADEEDLEAADEKGARDIIARIEEAVGEILKGCKLSICQKTRFAAFKAICTLDESLVFRGDTELASAAIPMGAGRPIVKGLEKVWEMICSGDEREKKEARKAGHIRDVKALQAEFENYDRGHEAGFKSLSEDMENELLDDVETESDEYYY